MTMAMSNVSSNFLTSSLLPSIQQTEATLASDGVELSTGQYADIGLQLGDQSGYELSLRNDNEQLQALTTSNSIVTTNLTTAQNTLNSILTAAQSAQTNLTTWTSESTAQNATLASIGTSGLQDLIASANITSNGTYVFGGENNNVAPMNNYFATPTSTAATAVNSAFQAALAGPPATTAATMSASAMQTFLNGPFAALFSGSAWSTNFSNASSTDTTAQIAPGETSTTSTNINQPGFQQLAQGYAMLTQFGNAGLSTAAQHVVASSAMSLITQGVSSITTQEANVGSSLSQVTDATSSMASQMTILQAQIGNLDNVNSSTVATELVQLSTQLQTAYNLTAQIQKLSLAQYLPVT